MKQLQVKMTDMQICEATRSFTPAIPNDLCYYMYYYSNWRWLTITGRFYEGRESFPITMVANVK